MKLPSDAKNAKLLSFGPMNHVAVRTDHVWETGLSEQHAYTTGNDAWAKDPIDNKSGSKVENQPFALTLEQAKIDLIS